MQKCSIILLIQKVNEERGKAAKRWNGVILVRHEHRIQAEFHELGIRPSRSIYIDCPKE